MNLLLLSEVFDLFNHLNIIQLFIDLMQQGQCSQKTGLNNVCMAKKKRLLNVMR